MNEGSFRTTLVLGAIFVLLLFANRWVLIFLVALELLVIGAGALFFISQQQKMATALDERESQLEEARRQVADFGAALQTLRLGRPHEVDLRDLHLGGRDPRPGGMAGSRGEEEPTWPGMRQSVRPRV